MDLDDKIISIIKDYDEIESSIKILQQAICSDSNLPKLEDISNTLEIILDKFNAANTMAFDLYHQYNEKLESITIAEHQSK